MDVSPESAARALMRRVAHEQADLAALAEALRRRLPAVAELLRVDFGARRIILFGSLAWGEIHAGSDVDLAVDGVPEGRLGGAMAKASRLAGHLVELFSLDELDPRFRERVIAEGEVLA